MHVCISSAEGYTDIAERLVESQYELTDRLTHFLCGKKPGMLAIAFLYAMVCRFVGVLVF